MLREYDPACKDRCLQECLWKNLCFFSLCWPLRSQSKENIWQCQAENSSVRLVMPCWNPNPVLFAKVFSIPYCHSFGFQAEFIYSLLYELKWGGSYCFTLKLVSYVFIAALSAIGQKYTVGPLYTFNFHIWHVCASPCHCVPWIHHSQTHTHTGLVKTRPNPERPECRGRVRGLGPLQLATGSHDSNNWVASQKRSFFLKGARLAENE